MTISLKSKVPDINLHKFRPIDVRVTFEMSITVSICPFFNPASQSEKEAHAHCVPYSLNELNICYASTFFACFLCVLGHKVSF
ncbi:hypothetical protein HZS_2237 [Henneguya salminicola]|nr:hypothetical protein HZS_2237 [Henneguya salminicola]